MEPTNVTVQQLEDAILHSDGDMNEAIEYLHRYHPYADRIRIGDLIKFYSRGYGSRQVYVEDLLHAMTLDRDEMMEYLYQTYPFMSKKRIQRAFNKFVTTITPSDVDEAIEFHNFEYGPDLKDKVVQYLGEKFPGLTHDQIVEQLLGYDFCMTSPTSSWSDISTTSPTSSAGPSSPNIPATSSSWSPTYYVPPSKRPRYM